MNRFLRIIKPSTSNQMTQVENAHPNWVAYEPELVPSLKLMNSEGITTLEEWFRWAEEWSMLLRFYGRISKDHNVLEIGCGLGRIAFPLRYILIGNGSYDGFDICQYKIDFLEKNFHKAYPNFRFTWANVSNTFYNPSGKIEGKDYSFPYPDNSFDIVFAASVFTHMLPEAAAHYLQEAARVLKPHGRCIFSFFLLDNYRSGQPRPFDFAKPDFNFDYQYDAYGDEFAIADPQDPEKMTAYRLSLLEKFANQAGLKLAQEYVPGLWSGSQSSWVGVQDLVIFQK